MIDRQAVAGDIPPAVVLERVVDQCVHQSHVNSEFPALAPTLHAAATTYLDPPGLGFAEPAHDSRPGETSGGDKQIGRPAESVAADQRQL